MTNEYGDILRKFMHKEKAGFIVAMPSKSE